MKKQFLLALLLSFSLLTYSQRQDTQTMGRVTLDELQMTTYDQDTIASAVILYEKKFVYPSGKKAFDFAKEYYARIKIFDEEAFSFADFNIPSYGNVEVENLEAITYNLDEQGNMVKSVLNKEDIFKEKSTSYKTLNKFTLPNVKVGSVIEYKYTVHRNNYKVHDFYFQGSIPSIKTEYTAHLSPYTNYNVRLIGYLKPDFSESVVKKKCEGINKCIEVKYVMTDIPAFYEEEYMTSKYNFMSRLSFEEKYKDRFVKEGDNSGWESLDKWVENTLETKLNKQGFYRRKLPESIQNESNLLAKAKKVYYYIQDHFVAGNTDGKTFGQSYKNRVTSSSRINISLYNALKGAGFEDVKFMMLSTRENGLPTKLHATLDDFNTDAVRLVLGGDVYLLDATDKKLPFGVLPFESLNGEGRVFDYDKGSYWETINVHKNNTVRTKVTLEISPEGTITGKTTKTMKGYPALFERHYLDGKSMEKCMEDIEAQDVNMEVLDFRTRNQQELGKPLIETYSFELDEDADNLYLEVAKILDLISENPFKLENRRYPVDYGYTRKSNLILDIKVPEGYELKSIPEDKVYGLQNNTASYILKVTKLQNNLRIFIRTQINKTKFLSDEYVNLKEFYKRVVAANNSFVQIVKKS